MSVTTAADFVIAPGVSASAARGVWRLEIQDLGSLGVVAKIGDDLDFTERLDSQISVDEEGQRSTGLVLKSLLLDILYGRDPLYRIQDWAKAVPLDLTSIALTPGQTRCWFPRAAELGGAPIRLCRAGGDRSPPPKDARWVHTGLRPFSPQPARHCPHIALVP